ncbi:MAG: glycosyltransferase family 9 protein [Bdellovibrionales bacterium]
MTPKKEHILVIRLGALGDLIFCFQAFHEIRLAHPDAEIALLTRAPFASFARSLPFFNRILIDTHPSFATPFAWARLRKEVAAFSPDRIYDLQGKFRQTLLYALLGGPYGPAWSGAAPFCRFPRLWPPEPDMHFTDFLAAQLRAAGVQQKSAPDLAWFDAPVGKFALPPNYAVLIPGCSPGAPHKRWPPQKFAALAQKMRGKNLVCVVVGTDADAAAVSALKALTQNAIDLCGKTSLFELAGILRRAAVVIGNDTGPLHMAAALGAPTLALFSGKSDPVWSRPPGPKVAWRQSANIADLGVDEIFGALPLPHN